MALNVMLVFFRQYNSRQLRHLEKWYMLFAYGVPFIPALVYIIIEKATHRRIYGPATVRGFSYLCLRSLTPLADMVLG